MIILADARVITSLSCLLDHALGTDAGCDFVEFSNFAWPRVPIVNTTADWVTSSSAMLTLFSQHPALADTAVLRVAIDRVARAELCVIFQLFMGRALEAGTCCCCCATRILIIFRTRCCAAWNFVCVVYMRRASWAFEACTGFLWSATIVHVLVGAFRHCACDGPCKISELEVRSWALKILTRGWTAATARYVRFRASLAKAIRVGGVAMKIRSEWALEASADWQITATLLVMTVILLTFAAGDRVCVGDVNRTHATIKAAASSFAAM